MNNRQIQIINILSESSVPVTSQEFSELLAVSSRTIKRIVWDADDELRNHGAQIISTKNGYSLEVHQKEQFDSFLKEAKRLNQSLSIEDELDFLILEKLLLSQYVTQDELSEETYVSRSTINKHIKNIKTILGKENIVLSNRPHYGYYLVSSESNIRNYMIKLLLPEPSAEIIKNKELIDRCHSYDVFYKDIVSFLSGYGLEKNDPRTQSIIKYFVIVAKRFENDCFIEQYSQDTYISNVSEELAVSINQLMERHFSISLDRNEIIYLSYIMGNPIKRMEPRNEYELDYFENVVEDFFQAIREVYQQDFSYDEVLHKGLVQHMYITYSRLYVNAFISNPLIDIIKTQYIEAYNYAVLCGNVLLEKYGLDMNEDSLSYVALHFAAALERMNAMYKFNALVVCDSGFGMAELLKTRISNKIKNLEIVEAVSSSDLYKRDLKDIILIISSVPIDKRVKIPVIVVNPLQLNEDILTIEEYLKDYQNIGEYKALFSENRFFPMMNFRDKETLINYITGFLIKENLLNEKNRQDILHREEISSTEINKYVAIPHCIIESDQETFFTIVTCKNAIPWGKGTTRIVFLGAIAKTSTINKKIFPMLYKITTNAEKVLKLAEIRNFNQFIDLLFSNLPITYD